MKYEEFLATKRFAAQPAGIHRIKKLHPSLFGFQKDVVKRFLKLGRGCIWADCGLGKTRMQLEWARQIPGKILIVAPLGVIEQTIDEGKTINVSVRYCRSQEETEKSRLSITNYDMLHHFQLSDFDGVVLDESSILKSIGGKRRNQIIQGFSKSRYRLACTATPAPNDYMEIGNHAEFVGAMTYSEMLSNFFVHDGGETQKWRLKKHAEIEFWRWICSWAVMFRKPSDLGYEDNGFILPAIKRHLHYVEVGDVNPDGYMGLFPFMAGTLQERIHVRKKTVKERVRFGAEIVNTSKEPWIIWCHLNSEADGLEKSIPDAIQIKGADSIDSKIQKLHDFGKGNARVMVTKPSIAGFGLNWQHCSNVMFIGMNDSWEQYYQAVRRCWRFGQKKQVQVHIISSRSEGSTLENILKKESAAEVMLNSLVKHMKKASNGTLSVHNSEVKKSSGKDWEMYLGDCVEVCSQLESDSIGFSVFSPPFASLYTYSSSERDMGNTKNDRQFMEHFSFLVDQLNRIMMPGREVAIHCFDIPSMKERDGVIGIKDFSNRIRLVFEKRGFIYHSRVTIWKDPVTQMQRTKALGLLHKQIRKDSSMCRQGLPDYLIVMRKKGSNPKPIAHTANEFPVATWQKWASPIWMDINPSDTLQHRSVREHKDERHICPLQLEVIRRAVMLWSNRGDLVLSPFAGIGSEGHVALACGRKFVGIELKGSYYKQAVQNLKKAVDSKSMNFFE